MASDLDVVVCTIAVGECSTEANCSWAKCRYTSDSEPSSPRNGLRSLVPALFDDTTFWASKIIFIKFISITYLRHNRTQILREMSLVNTPSKSSRLHLY